MTPSQLIHLARVAGLERDRESDSMLWFKNRTWISVKQYKPHTLEGSRLFRDLWLSLTEEQKQKVIAKWFHPEPEEMDFVGVEVCANFTTWLFTHPAEACQIIYEVTGGEGE